MANIILANAFDPKTVTFSTLEKNKKGGKVIFIGIPDANGQRQRITLQTPALALPFGVSPYTEASTGEVQSYSLDVSYRGADANPKVAEFLARMRELDDVLLDVAVENSKEWFGKKMSKEILSEFYRKLVKDSATPGQYPPVTKFKVYTFGFTHAHTWAVTHCPPARVVQVQLQDGMPTAKFFDEKRQQCGIEYLSKGSTVRCIVELDRIWFVNKNFGVTWRVSQAAVATRPQRMDDFAFQADGDDDDVMVTADEAPAAAVEEM
jgi:hypothetical protein